MDSLYKLFSNAIIPNDDDHDENDDDGCDNYSNDDNYNDDDDDDHDDDCDNESDYDNYNDDVDGEKKFYLTEIRVIHFIYHHQ